MSQELTTQEQFDAFADDVARELGTHCRTAPLPEYARGLARLSVDGDGRAVRLCQRDDEQPSRLKVYAAVPGESKVQTPSIRVTAISARHVAREITRRLYPLHTEAAALASQLTGSRQRPAPAPQSPKPWPARSPAPASRSSSGVHRSSGTTMPARPHSRGPTKWTACASSSGPPASR